jgi:hypothetical protein
MGNRKENPNKTCQGKKGACMKNLFSALIKAQKEIGAAKKDSENPFFKKNYADFGAVLEAVKDSLLANGLYVTQQIEGADIKTVLFHESGEFIESKSPIVCTKPNDPQAFGSAVTYSRRYSLQSLLCIPSEDDDGEKNYQREAKPEAKKEPPKREITSEEKELMAEIGKLLIDQKKSEDEKAVYRSRCAAASVETLRTMLKELRGKPEVVPLF